MLDSLIENTVGTALDWYVAGDLANTQHQNNLELQKLQHMYNRDMYQHRYQWTVEDLKKSGLNPILSVSRGMGQGTPAGVSAPSAGLPHMPGSFASGYASFQSGDKSEQEAKKAEAERTKILVEKSLRLEEIKQVKQNTLKARAESDMIKAREKEIVQNTWNLESKFLLQAAEFDKLRVQIEQIKMQTDVGHAQLENINQQTKNLEDTRRQILVTVQKLQAEYEQLQKITNVYTGPGGQAIAYVREILRALNIGIGALVPMGGKR